jgi:uncharacterized DUF497 family protein
MNFEWDDEKNHMNMSKHGIDFDTAKALWDDPNRVEILLHIQLKREIF